MAVISASNNPVSVSEWLRYDATRAHKFTRLMDAAGAAYFPIAARRKPPCYTLIQIHASRVRLRGGGGIKSRLGILETFMA